MSKMRQDKARNSLAIIAVAVCTAVKVDYKPWLLCRIRGSKGD